ncbi:MAG: phosphodiesterase [Eubacteriales bacterium]|nr:phosphodiesterase [Eubacteriales bacterium]
MKIFFASDIHGSASACEKMLEQLECEKADRLFLLGDLLYHGPRNDLPDRYEPKAVIKLLNECKLTPLCVRGNCDAEVDQMVLTFPIMADYALLPLEEERCAFITHGHLFNTENPPPHKQGDVLIHGHTHVHCVVNAGDYTYINPGSAALPKEGQPKSYMIYENGAFEIKALADGKLLKRYELVNGNA